MRAPGIARLALIISISEKNKKKNCELHANFQNSHPSLQLFSSFFSRSRIISTKITRKMSDTSLLKIFQTRRITPSKGLRARGSGKRRGNSLKPTELSWREAWCKYRAGILESLVGQGSPGADADKAQTQGASQTFNIPPWLGIARNTRPGPAAYCTRWGCCVWQKGERESPVHYEFEGPISTQSVIYVISYIYQCKHTDICMEISLWLVSLAQSGKFEPV